MAAARQKKFSTNVPMAKTETLVTVFQANPQRLQVMTELKKIGVPEAKLLIPTGRESRLIRKSVEFITRYIIVLAVF